MMRYKYILFFIVSFFIFNSSVNAALCDNEYIDNLRDIANKIEVSYVYVDNDVDISEGEVVDNIYSISIDLLSDDLYISDGTNNYYYEPKNQGNVTFFISSGDVQLDVYSKSCLNYRLRTIYLKLPKFNTYSLRQECGLVEKYNLDVCDPWFQPVINDNIFDSVINKYLKKDEDSVDGNIFKVIGSRYFIGICLCMLIILIIIFTVKCRKRSVSK